MLLRAVTKCLSWFLFPMKKLAWIQHSYHILILAKVVAKYLLSSHFMDGKIMLFYNPWSYQVILPMYLLMLKNQPIVVVFLSFHGKAEKRVMLLLLSRVRQLICRSCEWKRTSGAFGLREFSRFFPQLTNATCYPNQQLIQFINQQEAIINCMCIINLWYKHCAPDMHVK